MIASPDTSPLGIAVLGSTGSVGSQALQVIERFPDRFKVVALAARSLSDRFRAQVNQFVPEIASVANESIPPAVAGTHWAFGIEGLSLAATHPDVHIVVVATSGHDAIRPTLLALNQGKVVALANKETLVCAGELIMRHASLCDATIRPVDSEHSAIWQAVGSQPLSAVERAVITASGGPFRTTPAHMLANVTAAQALDHPTWAMGGKITIDSATMMNKGLEIIEAHWLFDLPYDRIDVIIHPESVVHSLVEFVDGSQIAQMGPADMRLPIQYALTYPDRVSPAPCRLDLTQVSALHFEAPDEIRFPALRLAREAGLAGETYPTVLSAADEVAVDAFLSNQVRFTDIPAIVERTLDLHQASGHLTLDAILEADAWARAAATQLVAEIAT